MSEDDEQPEEPDADEATDERDGIFSNVVGHSGAKAVCRNALRRGDVHVMLQGPPASGKSTMLSAIEQNVPGTIYRDCKRFTGTRIQSVLKEDPPILLLDEFDALGQDDYDVLSNPLEHGRVTEDTDREQYDIEIGTQVVAAANHTAHVPDNIMSRFRVVPFEGYEEDEALEVCERMLPENVEWIEAEEQAREVAEIVNETIDTHDPREVRDVARLSSSIEEVEHMSMAITDADAEVDSDPLDPTEVERAKTEVGREELKQQVLNGGEPVENADEIMDEVERAAREAENMSREEIEEQAERAVEREIEARKSEE